MNEKFKKESLNRFPSTTASMVNWVNSQGKCVESTEVILKNNWTSNYLKYIRDPQPVGTIVYSDDDLLIHNRFIFNTYLYEHPEEPISDIRLLILLKNIIVACQKENVTDIAIPTFNTYSSLDHATIESIVEKAFATYAPEINVTFYTYLF